MALKGDRYEFETTIDFFLNEVAERGGVVTISTAGSGAALDQSAALVTYAAAQSGLVPIGLLLNDMVNIDQTRQHINFHKDELQKGGKVSILKKGWVVTNMITGTPVAGALAYLDDATAGNLTVKANVDDGEYIPIGRFMSTVDEDGYVKVEVNLPAGVMNTDAGALE